MRFLCAAAVAQDCESWTDRLPSEPKLGCVAADQDARRNKRVVVDVRLRVSAD